MKKGIALVIVLPFMYSQIVWASPLTPSKPAVSIPQANLSQIIDDPSRLSIPFEHVTLKEVHKGANGKLLIHIQDAHANYSGQINLARALDSIMSQYDIPIVLVEGGARDVTLDPIKHIADQKTWAIAAKGFLMDGIISGEEYLNLTSNRSMKLLGIEYLDLYQENLRAYANLKEKRKKVLIYLHKINISLQRIKNKLYSKTLLAHETTAKKAQKNAGESNAKFSHILDLAEGAGISLQENYPQSWQLKQLQEEEQAITFDQANQEQSKAFSILRQKGLKEEVKKLLEASKRTKNAQMTQLKITQRIFALLEANDVEITQFQEFSKYKSYLEKFSELKLDVLLKELETLEDDSYRNILQANEPARKLRAIDRFLGLLDKAYRIKMSSDDYQALSKNESGIQTTAWQSFANNTLLELGYFKDLIAYKPYFEEASEYIHAFYRLVNERDKAFLENTNRLLNKHNQEIAFLIAGGYHTANLTRQFREAGYSYVVLTPNVTTETDHEQYEKFLLMPLNSNKTTTNNTIPVQNLQETTLRQGSTGGILSWNRLDQHPLRYGVTPKGLIMPRNLLPEANKPEAGRMTKLPTADKLNQEFPGTQTQSTLSIAASSYVESRAYGILSMTTAERRQALEVEQPLARMIQSAIESRDWAQRAMKYSDLSELSTKAVIDATAADSSGKKVINVDLIARVVSAIWGMGIARMTKAQPNTPTETKQNTPVVSSRKPLDLRQTDLENVQEIISRDASIKDALGLDGATELTFITNSFDTHAADVMINGRKFTLNKVSVQISGGRISDSAVVLQEKGFDEVVIALESVQVQNYGQKSRVNLLRRPEPRLDPRVRGQRDGTTHEDISWWMKDVGYPVNPFGRDNLFVAGTQKQNGFPDQQTYSQDEIKALADFLIKVGLGEIWVAEDRQEAIAAFNERASKIILEGSYVIGSVDKDVINFSNNLGYLFDRGDTAVGYMTPNDGFNIMFELASGQQLSPADERISSANDFNEVVKWFGDALDQLSRINSEIPVLAILQRQRESTAAWARSKEFRSQAKNVLQELHQNNLSDEAEKLSEILSRAEAALPIPFQAIEIELKAAIDRAKRLVSSREFLILDESDFETIQAIVSEDQTIAEALGVSKGKKIELELLSFDAQEGSKILINDEEFTVHKVGVLLLEDSASNRRHPAIVFQKNMQFDEVAFTLESIGIGTLSNPISARLLRQPKPKLKVESTTSDNVLWDVGGYGYPDNPFSKDVVFSVGTINQSGIRDQPQYSLDEIKDLADFLINIERGKVKVRKEKKDVAQKFIEEAVEVIINFPYSEDGLEEKIARVSKEIGALDEDRLGILELLITLTSGVQLPAFATHDYANLIDEISRVGQGIPALALLTKARMTKPESIKVHNSEGFQKAKLVVIRPGNKMYLNDDRKTLISGFKAFIEELSSRGIAVLALNSNAKQIQELGLEGLVVIDNTDDDGLGDDGSIEAYVQSLPELERPERDEIAIVANSHGVATGTVLPGGYISIWYANPKSPEFKYQTIEEFEAQSVNAHLFIYNFDDPEAIVDQLSNGHTSKLEANDNSEIQSTYDDLISRVGKRLRSRTNRLDTTPSASALLDQWYLSIAIDGLSDTKRPIEAIAGAFKKYYSEHGHSIKRDKEDGGELFTAVVLASILNEGINLDDLSIERGSAALNLTDIRSLNPSAGIADGDKVPILLWATVFGQGLSAVDDTMQAYIEARNAVQQLSDDLPNKAAGLIAFLSKLNPKVSAEAIVEQMSATSTFLTTKNEQLTFSPKPTTEEIVILAFLTLARTSRLAAKPDAIVARMTAVEVAIEQVVDFLRFYNIDAINPQPTKIYNAKSLGQVALPAGRFSGNDLTLSQLRLAQVGSRGDGFTLTPLPIIPGSKFNPQSQSQLSPNQRTTIRQIFSIMARSLFPTRGQSVVNHYPAEASAQIVQLAKANPKYRAARIKLSAALAKLGVYSVLDGAEDNELSANISELSNPLNTYMAPEANPKLTKGLPGVIYTQDLESGIALPHIGIEPFLATVARANDAMSLLKARDALVSTTLFGHLLPPNVIRAVKEYKEQILDTLLQHPALSNLSTAQIIEAMVIAVEAVEAAA